jgi:hypothetical protein
MLSYYLETDHNHSWFYPLQSLIDKLSAIRRGVITCLCAGSGPHSLSSDGHWQILRCFMLSDYLQRFGYASRALVGLIYTVRSTSRTGISPSQGRYLHTRNKRIQTSMSQVGFEHTAPTFERAKTVHALDRAASVIGGSVSRLLKRYTELSHSL